MPNLKKRIAALEGGATIEATTMTVEQSEAYTRLFHALQAALPKIAPLGVSVGTRAHYAGNLSHDAQVMSLDDRMQSNTMTPDDLEVLACLTDDDLTTAKTTASEYVGMMAGIFREF